MKKQFFSLALLAAAWLAGVTAQAQLDVSKVYTIESNNNAGKYMQDNGDGYIVTGALNANSYWKFETTGNDDCYYVKNAKTGKYMQNTSEYEVSVKTGDTSVEIYIKNDPAKGTTVYGMASTDRNPHDFANDNTYGANYNSGTGIVQGFSAALGVDARPNSFWKIIGHSFTNGVCSDNCTDKYQPATLNDEGWYELANAGNVEWFGQQVLAGHHTIKGKLTADIDYSSVENSHTPIGNDTHKFIGHFDGQGHRIKNMILNNPTTAKGVGFFGSIRGGGDGFIIGSDTEKEVNLEVVIKNLIIDSSCSITSNQTMTAGVVGRAANSSTGHLVTIENCINEANITSTQKNVGGILGTVDGTNLNLIIKNCANTGKIDGATTVSQKENAAICGWTGKNNNSNVKLTGCWNIGEVVSIDTYGYNLFRVAGSSVVMENNYDLNPHASATQGLTTWITNNPKKSGELCYKLNGDQSVIGWYQKLLEDDMPMPFAKEGAIVYLAVDQNCDGSLKGEATYSNNEGGSRDPHIFVNGICSVCNGYEKPALDDDGWYELTNAGNVEWISEFVAGEHGGNIYPKVKMMNDIDFDGVSHTPIGNSSGKKFNGIFDGQGHRITHMVVNLPDQECVGLIGWARGPLSDGGNNTTIQNLIIDKTCSFTGKGRVAAFIGRGEVSNDNNSIVYITNCVNEANVTANTGTCAAFVGTHNADDNSPRIWISGCANHGDITAGSSDKAAAFIGWYKNNGRDGGNSTIENSYNTGVVSPKEDDGTILFRGSYRTITNTYDLKNSENTQGTPFRGINDWSTNDPVASGELAYYINQQAGKQVFYQAIGTDAYPMPFAKEGAVVYQNGNYSCPNIVENPAYSNTENRTGNYTSHTDNTKGFCTYCDEIMPNHISADAEGFLPLSSSDDLVWFSAMVNAGNTTINGKLTSDVDMSSVTYTPIGNNANRYHGTFDGSGHKVNLNIDANAYGQGFISIATGGVTVKNLVVTGSVKNTGSKTAGIIAEAIGGGDVTIQNCGNEATIQGTSGETAAIIANNYGYQCTLNIENVYNIGNVSGSGDVSTICACQGNPASVFKNVYNSGSVTGATQGNFVRPSNSGYGTYTNCYSTTLSNDNASIISTNASAVASGELCAKLGFGFRQNLSSDAYPNFASDHGFVAQIGAAGYSTMYNVYSDVEIPSGIEAYAGVVNGESLSLVAIENKIAASEPVILKLKEGTDAGLFNFMPTTGATSAASNSLKGSDGTVQGKGNGVYALSVKNEKVGFYPVGTSENPVTIPEGKAYLQYTGGNAVKGFTFVFDDDDATGIQGVQGVQEVQGAIYNIAGQRISKMQKGINIVNGKKVLK